jgi:GTPase SAR1 family protein
MMSFFAGYLRKSDFESKPTVLLLGQYSTGKTTFIQYMLRRNFPGMRIGPEPTTDKFTAVMYGEEERIIPGPALSVDHERPYTSIAKLGNGFLHKFEASMVPAEILKTVTFIDTPGILSGEKQRIGREYDFPEVTKWFANTCDTILLIFDAFKLDISDEFKSVILALRGNDDKVRIILNKADQITTLQLVRVYGSLMWSLGKVVDTPEVKRVYIGSFWDKPYRNPENERYFRSEQESLIEDLNILPHNAIIRKINELVRRARILRVHMFILDYLKHQLPSFGKEKKQQQLIENMKEVYQEVSTKYKFPVGDCPDVEFYMKALPSLDFSIFPSLNEREVAMVDEILRQDLPNFMAMVCPDVSVVENEDELNPFHSDDLEWDIPPEFQEQMRNLWKALSPLGDPLGGGQLKQTMIDTQAPKQYLKKIWKLCDFGSKGKLDEDEFILAMWLSSQAAKGNPPPDSLPINTIPPSKRLEVLKSQF